MLKIDEWAKDKPKEIAIFAQQSALLIELTFNLLIKIKNNELSYEDVIELPKEPTEWLRFYHNHRHINKWLNSKLKDANGFFSSVANRFESFSNKSPDNSINTVNELTLNIENENLEELYKANIADIKSILSGNNEEYEFSPELSKSFMKPEFDFLIKVFIPCTLLYGEHPTRMLRKARLGDIEVLNTLLRIDKAVMHDPLISRQFHEASTKKNKSKFEALTSALQGNIPGQISLKKVKYRIGGLISVWAEEFGYKLTAPDIRSLFDAIAVDKGIDELIDTTLPDSDEAFSQAILRERRFWKAIP